ncbi:phosphoribosylformylglycinamidine synthase subunit PurS [bacterium LRH843]|nr:phosphoribosylformylglycinamidine synthase subunit PurS [bacterium LRH843]
MYKVKVYVTLKASVIDPQGGALTTALKEMDYNELEEVRVGKYIELLLNSKENIDERIDEMCKKLLVNTVIEEYRYDVEEVQS